MIPDRIVFWEPNVSPHKLALFAALERRGLACTYVAEEALPSGRAAQGWGLGEAIGGDIRVKPSDAELAALIADRRETSLHLFSGIRWVPTIVKALDLAIRRAAVIAIMSEPRASEGLRGAARLLHSRLTEGRIRRAAAFVLAIGRNGPPWFSRAGYAPERIFPFAYFLPTMPRQVRRGGPAPCIAYLGRVETGKGADLFLDLPPLFPDARFVMAGAGDPALIDRATRDPRIDYRGVLPMAEVPTVLAETDILVQPSRSTDDGWGAVVSEALLAGAAAVATVKVGASILLDRPSLGAVAEAATTRAVASAINSLVDHGRFTQPDREARATWAASTLTGEAGADRLLAIAAHVLDGREAPPPFPPPAPRL